MLAGMEVSVEFLLACYMLFLQTLSYNKYSLKPQTSEKQAKEILIRRQNTLRESMRKGQSLPWGKPVCGGCTQITGLRQSFVS